MRRLVLLLFIALSCSACGHKPGTSTPSTKDEERSSPDQYLKVNYEVHKNLVGKKVVEGEVINTGKYLTYKTVTLKIESINDGDNTSVTFTIPDAIEPGKSQDFKFKPEGNPDRVKVSVASASAD